MMVNKLKLKTAKEILGETKFKECQKAIDDAVAESMGTPCDSKEIEKILKSFGLDAVYCIDFM